MSQGKIRHKTVTRAIIALGSNLKSSSQPVDAALTSALALLADESLAVLENSSFYHTPAFPPGSGPDFVNAAAVLETGLDAEAVLARLHDVEERLGRRRRERWGPRVIDLDLLAHGDAVFPDEETVRHWMDLPPDQQMSRAPDRLILPHPRLHERAFVLIPLAEIAPDWRHPVLQQTVAEMAAALPKAARDEVRRIT